MKTSLIKILASSSAGLLLLTGIHCTNLNFAPRVEHIGDVYGFHVSTGYHFASISINIKTLALQYYYE